MRLSEFLFFKIGHTSPGLGVIIPLTFFQVTHRLIFPPFSIEQLKGGMESGSTVSSSFGLSPNLQLISQSGSFGAPVKTKKNILPLSIVDRQVHEVKLLVALL